MEMIALRDVTLTRGTKKIFSALNFTIDKGEHWLITGKNGSGKTSILELITGSLHPLTGTLDYDFITPGDWDHLYALRQQYICYIPAHSLQSFLPGTSGLFYQQRYYSIGDSELPRVKDLFRDTLNDLRAFEFSENFNIENLLGLEIVRLSNGQLKKVLILKNLINKNPKFLLLDYPFEGLDADSRKDLCTFIDHLTRKIQMQLIIVDEGHQLPAVVNRKLVLDDGVIQYMGELGSLSGSDKSSRITNTAESCGKKIIEMKDVTIQYGHKKIISNFNWTIHQGDRWALTGKNGKGKTTLFSMIYADHPMAYSQQVFLFGKRRGSGESIWDIKKRINYLGPEHLHFLDPATFQISGRQLLSKSTDAKQKAEELVAFFEAEKYIDRKIRELSSGQLQMVLLMDFFTREKELLLLDEPFQFLDRENKQLVRHYLHDYLHPDTTLVLITHDDRDVQDWTKQKMTLK